MQGPVDFCRIGLGNSYDPLIIQGFRRESCGCISVYPWTNQIVQLLENIPLSILSGRTLIMPRGLTILPGIPLLSHLLSVPDPPSTCPKSSLKVRRCPAFKAAQNLEA